MFGLAVSQAANVFILMTLYHLCLLAAQICFIIRYVQKVESCSQIADHCAPWNISNGMEKLILQLKRFEIPSSSLSPNRAWYATVFLAYCLSTFLQVFCLMGLTTQLTVVLHAGSRVIVHSFLSHCLCIRKLSISDSSFFCVRECNFAHR
jgi:hypothetical protein